jgi:hypothetical protein
MLMAKWIDDGDEDRHDMAAMNPENEEADETEEDEEEEDEEVFVSDTTAGTETVATVLKDLERRANELAQARGEAVLPAVEQVTAAVYRVVEGMAKS